jgi:hypothetical protein
VVVAKKKPVRWAMPAWMEPYREMIGNTGGNSIEDLMYRSRLPDTNVVINAPLTLICQSVESQVDLLWRLHKKGALK